MESLIIGWALESNFEYDYKMWWEPPKPLHTFTEFQQQYNQRKNDPYWCTWYAVMTCIANNWGLVRKDDDFLYMRNNAGRYGREDWVGMYLSKAGDMVVDYLNTKYPDQWWVKLAIDIVVDWKYYMDIGYLLHMGSKINKAYANDILDWLIERVWGKDWSWHSRSTTAIKKRVSIIENYVWWLPHNIIDIWDWDKINEASQFYRQAFIYYPTKKMPIEIPHPHMTVQEAEALEKRYPDLFTPEFSESVRAWIDLATAWKITYWYTKYRGIDWVMKMMIDINKYRMTQ